jgi:hypothetical protein
VNDEVARPKVDVFFAQIGAGRNTMPGLTIADAWIPRIMSTTLRKRLMDRGQCSDHFWAMANLNESDVPEITARAPNRSHILCGGTFSTDLNHTIFLGY